MAIEPGATALTRIPRAPYSTASARVEPLGRRLGRHVGRAARHREARLVGGDVDDRPRRPRRQEAADGRRAADHGEREVHVDEVEQLARGRRVDRGVAEDRGVVDPARERRRGLGGVGRALGDRLVARVAHHRGRALPCRPATPARPGRARSPTTASPSASRRSTIARPIPRPGAGDDVRARQRDSVELLVGRDGEELGELVGQRDLLEQRPRLLRAALALEPLVVADLRADALELLALQPADEVGA